MDMSSEDRNQFINAVKKETSGQIDSAKVIGDRRFETHEEAEAALGIAKEVAPNKHFEIKEANGKYYVEVK
ncbi:hypothetical protein FC56_GL001538 [Lentilactobacillus senioris DSM 24302 = JCM 17472]|uniref:Uncharacterized protein n=1 Tax=Lentilactobacillus senioris DSM 24302 = JCM 17472 TaxID=1423802 RepID=A0A0R2D436_9LACO|nr:hypothetical protein [Lentilactobacillus senioris]KRM94579.1 hypothetical protein FC56_GL001538 [Lentilactobacillus senioris DSM 24302 = JCM 17472]